LQKAKQKAEFNQPVIRQEVIRYSADSEKQEAKIQAL
ncbi:chemotaxis protein, partial [Vibrio sp. 1567]|nr:chemotaxis protein [Vibrio sp. 1567]